MSESTDVDMATVLDLERELQAPRTRADQARLRELLAPDFIEIGASGRRYDRASTLRSLAESATQDPQEAGPITVVGLQGRHLTADLIQVFWESHGNRTRERRSSLWRRTEFEWQLIYHQGTPVP